MPLGYTQLADDFADAAAKKEAAEAAQSVADGDSDPTDTEGKEDDNG